MAAMDTAPVGHDAFFEALSKTEGATAAVEGSATRQPGAHNVQGLTSSEEHAEEDEMISQDDSEDEEEDEEEEDDEDDDDNFDMTKVHDDDSYDGDKNADQYVDILSRETPEPGNNASASITPGGVLSTYQSSVELAKTLTTQRTMKGLERLQHEYATKAATAQDARNFWADEEQKLRSLKKQANAGVLNDRARLDYQEAEVNKAWKRYVAAQKSHDAAELALRHMADDGVQANLALKEENQKAAITAHERHLHEVRRAKKAVAKDRAARKSAEKHKQAEEEEGKHKEREAALMQMEAKQRLKNAQSNQAERLKEAETIRENKFQHDAQRLLNLKGSMDRINKHIKSSNESRRKRQQKMRKDQEQRRKELLDEGKNPYEVWRREEMGADKERQSQLMEAKKKVRSEKLLEQLMKEDRTHRKKKRDDKKKRKEDDNFQKEMGNYAKQERIAAYIRKMTIGKVDVLDPTGTAVRIDPSRVTIQKTHSFGLGRAKPAEVDLVEARVTGARERMQTWGASGSGSVKEADFGAQGEVARESDNESLGSNAEEKEELPSGKIWVPRLTKLEEQYLAAAKERQRQNITSVQRCWGKEFKAQAFLAKPSVISFTDFEVGQRYKQVIEVTNVSLTFNQFKLLPLEDKVKDFFEIHFVPPGRMSAGVTRYITIWFCPKVSQDFVSSFPILAKTGRIDFPLKCTTKKTILTITPESADGKNLEINFGDVKSGESGYQVLHVKNWGALPANFELEPTQPGHEILRMLTWKPQKGEFAAHATTNISFTFVPTRTQIFETKLKLSVNNGAIGDAEFAKEREITVRCRCVDVPIYVDQLEYDLKTCVFGHIFRESIVVHNRQTPAMKIQVEQPKNIEGELQLNPTLAYIQGHKEQEIQVKFSPKENFLTKHSKYQDRSQPSDSGAFSIPVIIRGADQDLPVCTAIKGVLTTNDIWFEPPSLAFGSCYVGSAVVNRLIIVNRSLLPQQFAFVRLPAWLSVDEIPIDVIDEEKHDSGNAGTAVLEGGGSGALGTLLPLERREVCVTYTPEAATEIDYKITFKAIAGSMCVREFPIHCTGQGVTPVLSLSHARVDMASIPCSACSRESVVVKNLGKSPYIVNLLMPPPKLSGLHATPICFVLMPNKTQRVQLDFKPTQEYANVFEPPPPEPQEDDPDQQEQGAPPTDANDPETPAEESPSSAIPPAEAHRDTMLREIREHGGRRWESEQGTIHGAWKLPICMKPHVTRGGGGGGGGSGGGGGGGGSSSPTSSNSNSKADRAAATIFLGVNTCVLQTVLKVEPTVVDFGEITVQQRGFRDIALTNLFPSEVQKVHVEVLPEKECFRVLNAARDVAKKPHKLRIEFMPQKRMIYQTTLQLYTQNTRVQVPLKGRGVLPVLKIVPEDGVLRLGSVVYNKEGREEVTKTFQIKNESDFELIFKLETVIPADPNHGGAPAFLLSPSSGVVMPNLNCTVTVTFRPHMPRTVFREKVLINVPNQITPTYVYLFGHCFKYQVWATSAIDFAAFGRAQAQGQPCFNDVLAVGTGTNADTNGELVYHHAVERQLNLTFEKEERSKYMLIGASLHSSGGTNTAYDFAIQQSEFWSYFTVEVAAEGAPTGKADKQAKGAIKPGDPPLKVIFRYSPPEDKPPMVGDVTLETLKGIGQYITCKVKGVLSGGYVPPSEPSPLQEISIELRAYLQQI